MPAPVRRWLAKLRPQQLAELEQVLAERRRILELPRRPMDEVLEEVFAEQASTLAALGKIDEQR